MTDATPTAEEMHAAQELTDRILDADYDIRAVAMALRAHAAQAVAEERERCARLVCVGCRRGDRLVELSDGIMHVHPTEPIMYAICHAAALRAGQPGQ